MIGNEPFVSVTPSPPRTHEPTATTETKYCAFLKIEKHCSWSVHSSISPLLSNGPEPPVGGINCLCILVSAQDLTKHGLNMEQVHTHLSYEFHLLAAGPWCAWWHWLAQLHCSLFLCTHSQSTRQIFTPLMERYLHSGTYARRRVSFQLRLLQLLGLLPSISIYLFDLSVNIWLLYCLVLRDYSLCSRNLINLQTHKALSKDIYFHLIY